jgi:PTH1 family peptidyl-tRNA hydrolase
MKFLIAGLGNIGDEYRDTRHNIGFLILDELAARLEVKFDTGRHAFVAEGKYKGKSLLLVKPTTYMNLSGKAVSYWLQDSKTPMENLLVVTDDLALPYGKIRIKGKGSDGGHNGLKHINETFGHTNYARLRFGIGDNFSKGRQVDYVLSPWNTEEQKDLKQRIDQAAEAVLSFAGIGLERTMNIFN